MLHGFIYAPSAVQAWFARCAAGWMQAGGLKLVVLPAEKRAIVDRYHGTAAAPKPKMRYRIWTGTSIGEPPHAGKPSPALLPFRKLCKMLKIKRNATQPEEERMAGSSQSGLFSSWFLVLSV